MHASFASYDLHFGRVHACLREVCGRDELLVDGEDTRTALRLLDALLVEAEVAWPKPGEASALTAPERDRLLAEIEMRTFGRRILGAPSCVACGEQFSSEFRLDELVSTLWAEPPPVELALPGGALRVPTGADELAVAGAPLESAVAALVARCAEGNAVELAQASRALAESVPVLDLELDAACPECGANNALNFNIQSYLLRALAAERKRIPRHMHMLARAYGWSASEILALPRSTRAELVRLVEDSSHRSWA
jgi:hypothetical protein